jgi:hypothetical protein
MKVTGAKEAAADLMSLARRSPRALERALYKFENQELTESKKLVPVEHGTLKDSGVADHPEWQGNTLTGEIGYGGAASEYALHVHEDLEAFHDDGQAKYLEQPLNESEPYFESRVGSDFQRFAGLE